MNWLEWILSWLCPVTVTVRHVTNLPFSRTEVWDFHTKPGIFSRLTPPFFPWATLKSATEPFSLKDGIANISILKLFTLTAKHNAAAFRDGEQFQDQMFHALFFWKWKHTHEFVAIAENESLIIDTVTFCLPLGPILNLLMGWFMRQNLSDLFAYRKRVITLELEQHSQNNPEKKRLKFAISGSSGLIGTNLTSYLTTGGHDVQCVVRPCSTALFRPGVSTVMKDDPNAFEDKDVVIHLSGRGILSWPFRFTKSQKAALRSSRVDSTRELVRILSKLRNPPKVLIVANGNAGYRQNTEDAQTEEDDFGSAESGFLGQLAKDWESVALDASNLGIRVITLRIGPVLTPQGGMLAILWPLHFIFLGHYFGNGLNRLSWVGLEEVLSLVEFSSIHERICGPINVINPGAVANREFSKILAHHLNRCTFLPGVPSFLIHLAFGKEMADETVLSDFYTAPSDKLVSAGYRFSFLSLEEYLKHAL